MQASGLQCMRCAGHGRRLLFICFAVCSAGGTVGSYVQLSALQCTATQALGLQCMRCAGRGRRLLFLSLAAYSARGTVNVCSARGTISLYVQLSVPMHSYAGLGFAVHAVCWTWPPLTFHMPRIVLSWRHRRLVCATVSSPMHRYAGFGLAVHAACWTWPPLTLHMPRSVLSSRHRQRYVQLSAPMRSYADFELAVHAVCWMWLPLTLPIPRSVLSSRGTVSLYVQLSALQCTAAEPATARRLCVRLPDLLMSV